MLPEVDPIDLSVRTIYPPELTSVKDAVNWLLQPTDYHLLTDYPAPKSSKTIIEQKIPAVARMHRTMPILHAIQLLIGEDNTIIIDRKHKIISFGKGHWSWKYS